MVVILDYGCGNLKSVQNAFDRIEVETLITRNRKEIMEADTIIIPGVGAFGDAMDALEQAGLVEVIQKAAKDGKQILGICLGMQILYEKGFEFGERQGLGLLKGSITYLDIALKVPHMGWNGLTFAQPCDPILKEIQPQDYVYFVHSYYAQSNGSEVIAYSDYEKKIPAIVRKGNVYGIQFHPEKSGEVGENILRAYKEIIKGDK